MTVRNLRLDLRNLEKDFGEEKMQLFVDIIAWDAHAMWINLFATKEKLKPVGEEDGKEMGVVWCILILR